jgi:DNA-binding winged helix-turn-helix (wHTH) protein
MSVNFAFRAIRRNQFVVFSGILIAVAIFFIASSFTKPSGRDLFMKSVNLTIREIGHHLLLQAGDSTSRVLPVKEISEGVFLLEFENEFIFKPDTLAALAQRFLAKTDLSDYTVTVYECFKSDIVYGFQISPPTKNIEACSGRTQPKGCYNIEIAFANFNDSTNDYTSASLILSGFLFVFSIVLIINRFGKSTSGLKKNDSEQFSINSVNSALPNLGKFTFDLHNQKLLFGNEMIILTDKECKILELLNRNFGELTSREDLIQEVWANEGVITGRSLDMFVSKLRKKLSADPELRITNIHGRGYKLEVVADLAESS